MEKNQLAALHSFAQSIFKCRDKEEEWQKLLHDAPNEIIQALSTSPSVLSDIITADAPEAVVKIIDKAFGIESDQSEAKDASDQESEPVKPGSVSDASTAEKVAPADVQTDDAAATSSKSAVDAEQSSPEEVTTATKEAVVDGSNQGDESKADAPTDAEPPKDDPQSSAAKPEVVAQAQQDDAMPAAQSPQADSESANQQGQTQTTAQIATSDGSDVSVPRDTSIQCSDQELVDFLTKVFEGRQEEGHLEKMLASASVGVLNRLQANPFYIAHVVEMSNENDLNDFIHLIQQTNGPLIGDEAAEVSESTQENIDYLLSNWAYINFDCTVTNKNNDLLKDFLSEGPEIRWLSDAGAPVLCQVRQQDEGNGLTVSMSLRGSLSGFDENYSVAVDDNTVDTTVYGLNESGAWRKMISAFDLVDFMKELELDHVKMREGHRMLMRNLWALTKINQIECLGFEPTPAESTWYEKREHYLKDKFTLTADNELRQTVAPGMSSTGTSALTSSESHEESEVQGSITEQGVAAPGSITDASSDPGEDHSNNDVSNANQSKATEGAGAVKVSEKPDKASSAQTKAAIAGTEKAKQDIAKKDGPSKATKEATAKGSKKSTDSDG